MFLRYGRGAVGFIAVAAAGLSGLMALLLGCAWLFRAEPPGDAAALRPTEEEMASLRRLQDQRIDPERPVRVQVPVDYSEGEDASWYPRRQSPLLETMVAEGALPPVAERTGPEPLVLSGVDGAANYGGTLYRLNGFSPPRLEPVQLVAFSPQGYPIVPNAAKEWRVEDDGRAYVFTLRRGMRWSDGQPFTSADILYWWEREVGDPQVAGGGAGGVWTHAGQPMRVEAPDSRTVVFRFAEPHALFLDVLATAHGYAMMNAPRHFLRDYHPADGDPARIDAVMKVHGLVNRKAVYAFARGRVEKPSLAPWIRRTETATPPETLVRNPYFWAVDAEGSQLPYIDRIVSTDKNVDMVAIAAAQGEVTVQSRGLRFEDYTLLMAQRRQYGYRVFHWLNGDGSDWAIAFNLNRRVVPGDRETADKARLLADRRFRQALSLAVDRRVIIDAVYSGVGDAHSVGPVASSPVYAPGMAEQRYGRFDRKAAGTLLDECGLTARDADGYRRFPDGPPLLFDLNYCSYTGDAPAQFILDDWRAVGLKVRTRAQDRTIFYVEKSTGMHDMTVWGGYGAFQPLLDMRYYLPLNDESNFAVKNAAWYQSGGWHGNGGPVAGEAPAPDSPLFAAISLYEQLKRTPSEERRKALFGEIFRLAEENVYLLNIRSPSPALAVVKDGIRNVPEKGVYSWPFASPSNLGLVTWCYERPPVGASEGGDILRELSAVTPLRPLVPGGAGFAAAAGPADGGSWRWLRAIVVHGLLLAVLLALVLAVVRHPFVLRRLLLIVPTLAIISVVSFFVIELPPGDAITSRIMQMQEAGGAVDQEEIDTIKTLFRTEEPAWKRYAWWMGLDWFLTFDARDEGLLQGNMGRSMMDLKPVNAKVGDRLLFTFLISLGTILFTWAVALPIGIYSAVRQYSFFDYLFTVGGFIGMCIPGFLLALLLMFLAESWFGIRVSGLLSPEYAAESGWSTGKVLDLLSHLWLPVLVQGIAGTAGMIRVMRANLLDELKKPYVVTARAKGVPPLRLLLKYPVRLALNPFISGIGGIFPELVSGGAIVAIVMSLPTIGPMQLDAVMQQDMYLAGSMLMVLSLLSVLGTLTSDILLLVVDPRIRTEGGAK